MTAPFFRSTTRMPQKACLAAFEDSTRASMVRAKGGAASRAHRARSVAARTRMKLDSTVRTYTESMVRTPALILLFSAIAIAQGTTTKAKPEDYPVHAPVPGGVIAAEYMVRSFEAQGKLLVTEDFLVVEIAAFSDKGSEFVLSSNYFSL